MEPCNDQQICDLIKESNTRRKGFELMVRQYSEKLYWQIRRIVLIHEDADDVLQNTFIKAWNSLDSFHGDAKLYTWLSRIAINEALDFMRKKKVRSTLSTDDADLGIANQLQADHYFNGDETEAQLQEAIAQLPDVQKTVFMLRYYEEMKYSEISKITGTTEGGLKASYHIAVKKIEDFFKRHD
ncbi:RNA polymerase sigma factor [Prevotella sp. E13-17]|uniref:RNA polymerase sigma factor n=1 Tax=Prevotella sp. E13-17 TaxID=2913616 RepID=UPI001EDBF3EE|nr:RNA polymerase sigma factor [Prevotella sp. E13-17]UKK52255.1 RNA polymerase sigma factor [Prevotella sp. E13-17]